MSQEPPETPGSAAEAWVLPWAEPFGGTAGGSERARLAAAFGAALRRTGSLMQLMGQAAADRPNTHAQSGQRRADPDPWHRRQCDRAVAGRARGRKRDRTGAIVVLLTHWVKIVPLADLPRPGRGLRFR